jgi:TatD family hydrolase
MEQENAFQVVIKLIILNMNINQNVIQIVLPPLFEVMKQMIIFVKLIVLLKTLLKGYKNKLCGGVFHCFTGNVNEARQLLEYQNFALGIGGVLTFKNSRLPEVLAEIPLERIVLETDAPYMAPVPMRGKRNESAFITYVIEKMAQCYAVDEDTVAEVTTNTANKIFVLADK